MGDVNGSGEKTIAWENGDAVHTATYVNPMLTTEDESHAYEKLARENNALQTQGDAQALDNYEMTQLSSPEHSVTSSRHSQSPAASTSSRSQLPPVNTTVVETHSSDNSSYQSQHSDNNIEQAMTATSVAKPRFDGSELHVPSYDNAAFVDDSTSKNHGNTAVNSEDEVTSL